MFKRIICSFLFVFSFLYASSDSNRTILVFDFGGVIGETDYHLSCKYTAQRLHISFIQAQDIVDAYKQAKEEKIIADAEFWRQYAAQANITLPKDWEEQFIDIRRRSIRLFPEMLELVHTLKKQGIRMAMLSNTIPQRAQVIRSLGAYDPFNPVALSYEIGVEKPDKQAFAVFLSLMPGVRAQDCIFIDDKEANIKVANEMGFDGIQFTSREDLVRELIKRGISVVINTDKS